MARCPSSVRPQFAKIAIGTSINIVKYSKLFKMIIYADDTTLYSTLDVFGNYISKKLYLELTKVADLLKLNKLSNNIKNPNSSYFICLKNKSIYQI